MNFPESDKLKELIDVIYQNTDNNCFNLIYEIVFQHRLRSLLMLATSATKWKMSRLFFIYVFVCICFIFLLWTFYVSGVTIMMINASF